MKELLTILIIDDDVELCSSLSKLFSKNGFQLMTHHSSDNIESVLKNNKIDLILLDIILPGEDGIALCKYIRSLTSSPIVMLTGIVEDVEKIISLEMGADAYLTKPFNSRVLMAQINSCLRRQKEKKHADKTNRSEQSHEIYCFNGWKLNITNHSLTSPNNKEVRLTSAEYTLLHNFVLYPQRVLSRDRLLDAISVNSASFDRSIDILISRLRAKIEFDSKKSNMIKTVRNMGYIFSCEVTKDYPNKQ